ncbi:ATP-binding protein [Rhodohalobacter sp. SW132]|uniref:AAA family ATPase n=1 Tax=Rhodohalobacter sp. SW132 TaxID=2293433 RepID=UPI000E25A872|nr:ATP-binding protein [Rhodohalobacter sp. SW132]REL24039.1 ATP-binding protein [Rhodohalobacter sp. SW132]
MHKKEQPGSPGSAEKKIQAFISDELCDQICRLRSSFRKPLQEWFAGTRDEIQRIRKDDEFRYRQIIDLISRKIPDLQSALLQLKNPGWHSLYREAINTAASSIPETVAEIQHENRFQVLEGDSLRIKTGKHVKRVARSVFRKKFERRIYLRQLFLNRFLHNTDAVMDFAAREYDECAMLLDLLLEKRTEIEKQKKKTGPESHSTFQVKILDEIEEQLQVAVQHLKQFEENNKPQVIQWLDNITPDLLEKTSKAGTIEHRQKVVTESEFGNFKPSASEKLIKQCDAWADYLHSQLNDLRVQTEIARYGSIASEIKEELLNRSHIFFRDTFYLPIEEGVESVKTAIEKIRSLNSSENKKETGELDRIRLDLLKKLEHSLLEPMREQDRLLEPVDMIRNKISDLQVESRRFTDELTLAQKRVVKYPIPDLTPDTIRWQSLAARYLKEQALKKLDPTDQNLDLLIREILTEVEEAVQVTDVNILAAIESNEEGGEEKPLQIALDGLERAVITLEKSIKQVREKQNTYDTILRETLPTALHELARTMLNKEFDRFEMRDKALMVKEQAINWQQKLTAWWAATSERAEISWRFIGLKIRTGFKILAPYLGFRAESIITIKEKRNLAEYLARPGVESDLPFIYKRLFNRDFPIDERFYVPPKKSQQTINGAFGQWNRGLSANVAIIGEKGSGKSTMLRFAQKDILEGADTVTVHFEKTFTDEKELLKQLCSALGFKQTESRDEFLEKVDRKRSSSVVVVENLQNIFIRNINGYEALEAFWVIMSSTMEKLFWVVTTSRYSWNFFMKMSDADQYFSHVVFADQLNETEIREVILARHRSTGYELYFEPGESLKKSRAYKKLAGNPKEAQKLVRDHYFSKLSRVSEGNPSIAMIFWVQSVKEFDTQRFVFKPLEITEVDKLEVPSRDVLFTLAALVIHDTLTKEEVALALHQDTSQSSLMLARLKTKGIVYTSKSGYNLNHLVYRQVVRLLKRRNFIH